ncbi:uncharacterized protein G2W53_002624 [Senna tora]|uniref:Uncharacterized protein n=1 Tax=Senna tora TaxID=362788 RepID=A0A835CEZ0_9FABA|nr:uncharacterized protein G2W53_002624 [Senna tora]
MTSLGLGPSERLCVVSEDERLDKIINPEAETIMGDRWIT